VVILHLFVSLDTDHVVTSPSQERMTLKRVVDFVKDKGDENLKDMNRRLQRMLEETLTKNMHLQQVTDPSVHCDSFCVVFLYNYLFLIIKSGVFDILTM